MIITVTDSKSCNLMNFTKADNTIAVIEIKIIDTDGYIETCGIYCKKSEEEKENGKTK